MNTRVNLFLNRKHFQIQSEKKVISPEARIGLILCALLMSKPVNLFVFKITPIPNL
ncbi:hypothetical protein SAMN06265367_108157 [Algoriphagus winogradskyi]|uniref:Uncharacterized protein n=1 Tax=Algoriphagus winogradskyi TaxID=237017 RepID=A0ABY1PFK1_9BACT|nr:hypothetical protein SAMN06265367_108157 [Algoriphagus winogradskyi]